MEYPPDFDREKLLSEYAFTKLIKVFESIFDIGNKWKFDVELGGKRYTMFLHKDKPSHQYIYNEVSKLPAGAEFWMTRFKKDGENSYVVYDKFPSLTIAANIYDNKYTIVRVASIMMSRISGYVFESLCDALDHTYYNLPPAKEHALESAAHMSSNLQQLQTNYKRICDYLKLEM